jgi:hypothetical protein
MVASGGNKTKARRSSSIIPMSSKSKKEGDCTSGDENKSVSDVNNGNMKEVMDCLHKQVKIQTI